MGKKTKNVIIEASIHASKIDHQKHNAIKQLNKATGTKESSNLSEPAVKKLSRHDRKKAFYRHTSC